MTRMPRRARAFTLIELMLASSIAAIIGLAAASLAGAMARQVRQVEEQGDVGARTAIAHEFFATAIDGLGYNWKVEDFQSAGSGVLSGSPGRIRCHDTAGTSMCTGGAGNSRTIEPLQVCASSGLSMSTCNDPVATAADGIRAIVPRDGVSEAVRIVDKDPAFANGTCNSGNVGDPQIFDAQGAHATAWAVGDYVLIAGRQHGNIGVVTAVFAAENNPDDVNDLTVSVGDVAGLDVDDDGYSGCDAMESFQNARVTRVKRVLIRLDQANRTLEMMERSNVNDVDTWVPVLTDVDDLQVQLASSKLMPGASFVCLSEGMDGGAQRINNVLYNRGNLGGACPNGEPLARDNAPDTNVDDDIIRINGLRIGVLMGAGAQTIPIARTWKGMFDRAPTTIATDRRLRRPLVFFVGLPNATAY